MNRAEEIVARFRLMGTEKNREGMAKYGINVARAAGVPPRVIRGTAMQVHRDHSLAQDLWQTGLHEARILATIIADPDRTSDPLLETWAADIDSWDLCDQFCQNLVWRTHYGWTKAEEWVDRPEEFVRRAAFVTQAVLAKKAHDALPAQFTSFLPLIRRAAGDQARLVRKAIVMSLKNIGQRDDELRTAALKLADELAASSDKNAVTVGKEAKRKIEKGK